MIVKGFNEAANQGSKLAEKRTANTKGIINSDFRYTLLTVTISPVAKAVRPTNPVFSQSIKYELCTPP